MFDIKSQNFMGSKYRIFHVYTKKSDKSNLDQKCNQPEMNRAKYDHNTIKV